MCCGVRAQRNMAMSVAGEGEGENSDTCRSGVRSHHVSTAVNNVNMFQVSVQAKLLI